jgi:hypothetical protein
MMAYTRGGLVLASNKKFYRIIIRAAFLDNSMSKYFAIYNEAITPFNKIDIHGIIKKLSLELWGHIIANVSISCMP